MKSLIIGFLTLLSVNSCWGASSSGADLGPAKYIGNFAEVVPGKIFRGARPDAQGIDALAKIGVRTIIDLQGGDLKTPRELGLLADAIPLVEPGETAQTRHDERILSWKGHQIHFHNIPLDSLDAVTPAENHKIDRILEIMHDPKNQPVFVHCEHGKDRTGLIIALYRLRYDNYTIAQAHDEMVKMGHSGFLDWFFTGALDKYFYKQGARILAERASRHWDTQCPGLFKSNQGEP